jgi:hypothetical protein
VGQYCFLFNQENRKDALQKLQEIMKESTDATPHIEASTPRGEVTVSENSSPKSSVATGTTARQQSPVAAQSTRQTESADAPKNGGKICKMPLVFLLYLCLVLHSQYCQHMLH